MPNTAQLVRCILCRQSTSLSCLKPTAGEMKPFRHKKVFLGTDRIICNLCVKELKRAFQEV